MTQSQGVSERVAIADPGAPTHVIKPNADGSINTVGGSGDGGPVTIANGADVTQGAIADAAVTNPASSGSVIALLKGILTNTKATVLAAGSALIGKVNVNGYSFSNITTSTTTTVLSGAGTLHGVTVNALGTIASTIVIYDNTAASGTKIGTINSLTLSGFFEFDVNVTTGITLVTTGAPDITVSWR